MINKYCDYRGILLVAFIGSHRLEVTKAPCFCTSWWAVQLCRPRNLLALMHIQLSRPKGFSHTDQANTSAKEFVVPVSITTDCKQARGSQIPPRSACPSPLRKASWQIRDSFESYLVSRKKICNFMLWFPLCKYGVLPAQEKELSSPPVR